MNASFDTLLYSLSQLFLLPVQLCIALLFLYAFYASGVFAAQALQRALGHEAGFELQRARRRDPTLSVAELEALALRALEWVRITARVAPMLGLVATMIPMGPALRALADGKVAEVSRSLAPAFSAVIVALVTAALAYLVANIRRRWYSCDLVDIERALSQGAPQP